MLKRINTLSVVIALIICGLSGYAQNNNTTSPFSRYGIGELSHYSFGRSAAMGGASLGSRLSTQVNSANPASYNSVDSLSIVFEFGVDGTLSRYKSATGSLNTNDVNFRYFSLNWPITRWMGAALGLEPYSDMGYEVGFLENVANVGIAAHSYKGEGSTSKAFFGTSISPIKNLSIGANLNYIFGRLNQNTGISFDNQNLFYLSKTEGTRLRDFSLTYGLQYQYKLKNNQSLTLGLRFENESDFTVLHRIYSFKTVNVGTSTLTDTLQYSTESKNIIKLPSTFGIGLSYVKNDKLEINADYYNAFWSKATFLGRTDELLTDKSRFSAGFEYIPEAFSIRSFAKRVRYRAGFHYENSYLKLNNQQIDEIGISFGAGIPLPKSKSTANFAIEAGKKGTTENNLVRNNYMKFSLYLNLHDYWFVKRKFD